MYCDLLHIPLKKMEPIALSTHLREVIKMKCHLVGTKNGVCTQRTVIILSTVWKVGTSPCVQQCSLIESRSASFEEMDYLSL